MKSRLKSVHEKTINKRMLMRPGIVSACASLMMAGGVASAQTATTTFQVSANVLKACTVAATDLLFGTYDPTATTPLDATNTILVNCTNGTTYEIGLNLGANPDGTTRRMTNGTDFLAYELYQDSARTTVWGNTPGTDTVSSTGTGTDQNFTVYGRIPEQQNISAGAYTDTVNVTVTY